MDAIICRETCVIPEELEEGEEVVQEETMRRWSNPLIWNEAGFFNVPEDGYDVIIPNTWRVLVDVETAKLRNLDVRGTLIIP